MRRKRQERRRTKARVARRAARRQASEVPVLAGRRAEAIQAVRGGDKAQARYGGKARRL